MRRGLRILTWYLLLVAILDILSRCQSLRDLERFAIRQHVALTSALKIELTHPPQPNSMRTPIAIEAMAPGSWEISERRRCRRSRPEAISVAIDGVCIDPLWHAERDARHCGGDGDGTATAGSRGLLRL
jgi:hypothetical protein